MNRGDGFEVVGTRSVQDIMENIAPRHANNLSRATVHGVAGRIAKEAKQSVPVRSGNLKKSIKAKRRKSPPGKPISEVVGEGAFYWRFVEYGTRHARGQKEQPFVRPAIDHYRANWRAIFTEEFGKKLEKALAREAKKRAKTK